MAPSGNEIALEPVTFASDVQPVVANSKSKKAAAEPPLTLRAIDGDHGFTVGPNSEGSVVEWLPHSGVLVLPNITSPAARYRSTIHADSVATCVRNAREPIASSRSGQ